MKEVTLKAAEPSHHIGNSTVERNAYALKFAIDVYSRSLYASPDGHIEAADQIVDIARTFAGFMWEEQS